MSPKKNKLEKISLISTPSPLMKMSALAEYINADKIFIKRDDLLGRILGGNKLRKLEYILPPALKQNTDTLITTGSFESNHVCMTAAVASMLNLDASVVLMGPAGTAAKTLNEKIENILGAQSTIVTFDENNKKDRANLSERVSKEVDKITNELISQGKKPFFVPAAGCCLEGTYAFVEAFDELFEQMKKLGIPNFDILLPVGTGSTFSGLWCGAKKSNADVKIFGISIARKNPRCIQETITAAKRVCDFLELPVPTENELNITDKYIGQGYAKATELSEKAITIAMQKEALLLDHTYTGKAMGAFLDMFEKKMIGERPVVFWHTGGISGSIDRLNNPITR